MDISETLAPASDQLDAIELAAGPRIFVIEKVTDGSAGQPVQIHFVDFPRPWRPGLSMRRVLAMAWGKETDPYEGRRVKLYIDTDVHFGKERVGGTRIAALSDIDKTLSVPLPISRGRYKVYTVEPLPPNDFEPTAAQVAACEDQDALRAMWSAAGPEIRALIEARVQELKGATQ